MQLSNERLTTVPGSQAADLNEAAESDKRGGCNLSKAHLP
jgi:hypothetical protein